MKLPVTIVFRDLQPVSAIEEDIRRRVAKFDQFVPDAMSCHVVIESEGNRHRHGQRYTVRIDVRVPGEQIVAGDHHADADIALAVRGAFEAMVRRLEDYAQRRRGEVKPHR
ncbi:MAG: ribosome-associated translation inhibitor RaiA [Burkholderiaceae bacterium]|nr:ribosome-associated translation inhibitor RaiA [Burkholderiaceae bacterium]